MSVNLIKNILAYISWPKGSILITKTGLIFEGLDRGSRIWCRCVKMGIPYMTIPEHYSRLLKGLFLQRFSFQACPKMDLLSFVKRLIPIPSFSLNRYCSSTVQILSLGQTSSRLSTPCVYIQIMHSFLCTTYGIQIFSSLQQALCFGMLCLVMSHSVL